MKISLQQEYLQRNNCNIPIVLYNSKTYVFIKDTHKSLFRTISILWRHQESHPGFYEVTYSEPIHNGFESHRFVKDFLKSEIWHWDQYEKNILNLVASIKKEEFKAIDSNKQILAAWQIFLTITDSWLAKTTDRSFLRHVEQSLDNSLSISKRLNACKVAQEYLKETKNKAFDFWFFQIRPFAKDQNNQWLIDLINR
jgi:hypothetical protein